MFDRVFKRSRPRSPAFDQGRLAFSNGVGLSQNPYRDSDSDLAAGWEEGWKEGHEARKAFEQAMRANSTRVYANLDVGRSARALGHRLSSAVRREVKLNWFLAGLIVGAIVAAFLLYQFGNRYHVSSGAVGITVKVDTWTGRSWMMRYYEEKDTGSTTWYWEEIHER